MDKIKIEPTDAFLYPMPLTIVGAVMDGKADFMAAAWVSRVNFKPAMMMVALGAHHTLAMPDNGYWRMGEKVGRAWSDGKKLKA